MSKMCERTRGGRGGGGVALIYIVGATFLTSATGTCIFAQTFRWDSGIGVNAGMLLVTGTTDRAGAKLSKEG
eukprot:766016-Hanusia_phi.AAC.1